MFNKFLSVFCLFLIALPFSQAQEVCGEFAYDDLEYADVARIKGATGSKAYFYTNDDDCMSNGRCKTNKFVLPNDYILVSSPTDYSACGLYVARNGVETRGWIKGGQISYNVAPPKAQWVGTWKRDDGESKITIRAVGNRLNVSGFATFRTNGGEFSASGTIEDGVLRLTSEGCGVRMAFLGTRLYVVDNDNCGGLNVSFTGSYKK